MCMLPCSWISLYSASERESHPTTNGFSPNNRNSHSTESTITTWWGMKGDGRSCELVIFFFSCFWVGKVLVFALLREGVGGKGSDRINLLYTISWGLLSYLYIVCYSAFCLFFLLPFIGYCSRTQLRHLCIRAFFFSFASTSDIASATTHLLFYCVLGCQTAPFLCQSR